MAKLFGMALHPALATAIWNGYSISMTSKVDNELETLIRARYPIVYVMSWEEKRVEDSLRAIARDRGKQLKIWTVTTGFTAGTPQRDNTTRDPLAALDYVMNSPDNAIFLLKDF